MSKILSYLKIIAGTLPPRPFYPSSFLAATHVCSRWRTIALNCKDLWTDIHLQSRMWTRISLERSAPYPLAVRCVHNEYSDDERPDPAALALALDELPRIRELALEKWHPLKHPRDPINIPSVETLVADAIRLLSARSAPLLEVLSLDFPFKTSPGSLERIFHDEIPSALLSLNLRNCQISPSSTLFTPTLILLHLSDCVVWRTDQDFRETFSHMPHLQDVSVIPVTAVHPAIGTDFTRSPLYLPETRKVTLVGSLFYLVIALRQISISCDCDELDVTFTQGDIITPVIPQRYASSVATTVKKLLTHATVDASYEVVALVQPNDLPGTAVFQASSPRRDYGRPGLPATLQIAFSLSNQSIDIACILLHLLPWTSRVRTLRACHPDLTAQHWFNMSHPDGGPETIIAERGAAQSLVEAFDHAAQEGISLFPQLCYLHIVDVVLGSLGDADGLCRGLVSELGRRRERGRTCKLTISMCDVAEDVLVEMRQRLGVEAVERDDGNHDEF
ncbi:hypothetical protein BV25DRAFT_1916810 [Artomyces pyxidatus]|uniref:Uncharacterized protein n=1 Tax=Artomyces pyxidatus TaxID=48021 RepID=A0ACB8SZY9_9AGAM|nr:hypothetical protein BV25DRAFT_1916810 [Artomyces pyxidatus]